MALVCRLPGGLFVAEVFISYARVDRQRIQPILDGLAKSDIDYWLDDGILTGAEWRRELDGQLNVAKAVLVVWSKASVESDHVIDEAQIGASRRILVPVQIDGKDVAPPIGFRGIQTADLSHWHGDLNDVAWRGVIKSLRRAIDGRGMPTSGGSTAIEKTIVGPDSFHIYVDRTRSDAKRTAPPPWQEEIWKRQHLSNPVYLNLTNPFRRGVHEVIWHGDTLFYARGRRIARFRKPGAVVLMGEQEARLAAVNSGKFPLHTSSGGSVENVRLQSFPPLQFIKRGAQNSEVFELGIAYIEKKRVFLRIYQALYAGRLHAWAQFHGLNGEALSDPVQIGDKAKERAPNATILPSASGNYVSIQLDSAYNWADADLYRIRGDSSAPRLEFAQHLQSGVRRWAWHRSRDLLLTRDFDTGLKHTPVIVEIYNPETRVVEARADIGLLGGMGSFEWSVSGRYIAADGANNKMRIADFLTNQVFSLGGDEFYFPDEIKLFGISPDEQRIFVIDRFDRLRIFSMHTGELLTRIDLLFGEKNRTNYLYRGPAGPSRRSLWSEDGRKLVVRSGRDIAVYSL